MRIIYEIIPIRAANAEETIVDVYVDEISMILFNLHVIVRYILLKKLSIEIEFLTR